MIVVHIPGLRLKSPLNNSQGITRGAAMGEAARRKKTRFLAKQLTIDAIRNAPPSIVLGGRVVFGVRIIRIAPRPLDTDNLAAAAKSVRDGVADALGCGDAQQGDFWTYRPENQGRGVYAVRVEILEHGDT
jgi:hypothetical protein